MKYFARFLLIILLITIWCFIHVLHLVWHFTPYRKPLDEFIIDGLNTDNYLDSRGGK